MNDSAIMAAWRGLSAETLTIMADALRDEVETSHAQTTMAQKNLYFVERELRNRGALK